MRTILVGMRQELPNAHNSSGSGWPVLLSVNVPLLCIYLHKKIARFSHFLSFFKNIFIFNVCVIFKLPARVAWFRFLACAEGTMAQLHLPSLAEQLAGHFGADLHLV